MLSITSCEQFNWKKSKKDAQKGADKWLNDYTKKPLNNDEVVKGLREALNVGTNKSTASASKQDGFLKNALITIPFPPDAVKVKNTVENI